MDIHKVIVPMPLADIEIETGRVARQAGGAVLVRAGETVVLATAVGNHSPREGIDFFPLTVEYREGNYAAGKIPGGFFKREGRPTTKEILGCRLTDRPIRPLFPEGYTNEVQIIIKVLSYDGKNEPNYLGTIAASAALHLSDIPFLGPVGACRIGYIDGEYVVNYFNTESEETSLDLLVAGTRDAVMMVECKADNLPEDVVLGGIEVARRYIAALCDGQDELRQRAGKPKVEFIPDLPSEELISEVAAVFESYLDEAVRIRGKLAVNAKIKEGKEAVKERFAERVENGEVSPSHLSKCFEILQERYFKRMVLRDGKRPDGRAMDETRPITIEVGLLPRTHGSALFTRGETQSLGVVTLGIREDQQIIEGLDETFRERFLLHYNFPPFSVGEIKRVGSPGRREIGHGVLAQKALQYVLPSEEEFPYTIRIVSEILESNGSSSQATICSGSLAMMDAGIPVKEHVGGIAMGLVMDEESGEYRILTDIQGWEDHFGDMDFKVAGTRSGITALQMDIKVRGVDVEVMSRALEQAHKARQHILDKMYAVIDKPRDNLSAYAPRIYQVQVKLDQIGTIIGPQGRTIRHIIDATGVKIDIDDQAGVVNIVSTDEESANKAIAMVEALVEEPELGKIYNGKVVRITKFGAFVEILPGKDGLVHVSDLDWGHVKNVEDVVKVGDVIPVKLIEIDDQGRLNLSRREAMKELGYEEPEESRLRREREGRDREHRRPGGGRRRPPRRRHPR